MAMNLDLTFKAGEWSNGNRYPHSLIATVTMKASEIPAKADPPMIHFIVPSVLSTGYTSLVRGSMEGIQLPKGYLNLNEPVNVLAARMRPVASKPGNFQSELTLDASDFNIQTDIGCENVARLQILTTATNKKGEMEFAKRTIGRGIWCEANSMTGGVVRRPQATLTSTPTIVRLPTSTPTVTVTPTLTSRSNGSLLLSDEFNGTSINTTLWQVGTNSSGSKASLSDGNLVLQSGTTNGGGIWVLSNRRFTPGNEALTIDVRAKIRASDGGDWGFWGSDPNCTEHALFNLNEPEKSPNKVFMAAVGISAVTPCKMANAPLPTINPTLWHTYRIQIARGVAKFYVDDQSQATLTQSVPQSKGMQVRLDRVSWGTSQTLFVDYVQVQSSNASP